MFVDFVGEVVGIDVIDLIFEDCWYVELLEWELQDQCIGLVQFVLFIGDVDVLLIVFEGVQGSCGRIEVFVGFVFEVVVGIEYGFLVYCVEV